MDRQNIGTPKGWPFFWLGGAGRGYLVMVSSIAIVILIFIAMVFSMHGWIVDTQNVMVTLAKKRLQKKLWIGVTL
jgi:hypothetical protein